MEKAKEQLGSLEKQMAAAKEEVGKPFPQEAELQTKSARLAELDALLNMDGGQNAKGKGKEDRQDEQPAQAPRPSIREMLKVPCRHGEPKQQKEREEQVL